MFQVAKLAAFALTASSVSALVVPRAAPPAGWSTDYLEDYDVYHTRYLALGCQDKHGTEFFDLCCHPLLAGESLSSRPAQCDSTVASAPEPSQISEEGDCNENDDDVPAFTTETVPRLSSLEAAAISEKTTPDPVPDGSSQKSASTSLAAGTVNTGGFATYFYQNGIAGACGKVHGDDEMIAAIDGDRYGNLGAVSSECGKRVKITNTNNKKSVTVTITDACPTCDNSNSIDLSRDAFKKIAALDEGKVPITWTYV